MKGFEGEGNYSNSYLDFSTFVVADTLANLVTLQVLLEHYS